MAASSALSDTALMFVRAWAGGLVVQAKVGANPFKMGVVGASDFS